MIQTFKRYSRYILHRLRNDHLFKKLYLCCSNKQSAEYYRIFAMMCFKPISAIFLLCDCFEFPLFVRISFLKECIYRTRRAEYFSKQHSSKRKLENLQRLINTKTQHPTHHLLTCFFSRPLRTQQYQASSRSIMFSLTAYIIISNLK